MNDYQSNLTLAQAVKLLAEAGRIVVTTHAKPDGDAFGAVVGMSGALRKAGLAVTACFMPPVPASFRLLRGCEEVKVLANGERLPEAPLTLVLDTGAWSQLVPIRQDLQKRLDRTLILDHHISGDVPAGHRYIDVHAAASSEIVAEAIDALALEKALPREKLYDATVAEALFVGLASDTGWFRFSNTRPLTHELAARLLRMGVNHAELYQKLEQTDRPEKLMLLIRALSSLQLVAGGRAALMVLRREDFTHSGALIEETERFVDIPQVVSTVEVVVLITEPPPDDAGAHGPVRLSFRSKPGHHAVNVADLAKAFGGGGHARAAGAKIDAPLEQVIERVTATITTAIERPKP